MFDVLKEDWRSSKGNPKSCLLVTSFRIASWCCSWHGRCKLIWIIFLPYLVFYRVFNEWILGVEIPQKTKIGPGLRIEHGFGLVINDRSVIGRNVTIRHLTTIGNKGDLSGECPKIGDYVNIGCNAVIIGGLTVGDHAVIAAGAVVSKDVPPYSVVGGVPARLIQRQLPKDAV